MQLALDQHGGICNFVMEVNQVFAGEIFKVLF